MYDDDVDLVLLAHVLLLALGGFSSDLKCDPQWISCKMKSLALAVNFLF